MHINDLLNITGGKLANTPKVQRIEGVTLYPSKVEEKDLFFSNDSEQIQKAIDAGAYAIIYSDHTIKITDSDIAWIKVDNPDEAIIRFLRYIVVQKEVRFALLQTHALEFFKMITPQKRHVAILKNDLKKLFEQIVNSNAVCFVADNAPLIQKIAPGTEPYAKQAEGYMIQDTLLRSTFKVEGFVYQQQPLAPFHLDFLLEAVAFAKEEMLAYSIDRLRYMKRFYPIFLDDRCRPVAFGRSDKVVIFVDDTEDIVRAREYIAKHNKWLKSIVLTPPQHKIEGVQRSEWVQSEEELIDVLKKSFFNYAFVYKADPSLLQRFITEQTLF